MDAKEASLMDLVFTPTSGKEEIVTCLDPSLQSAIKLLIITFYRAIGSSI
jgi:hypothetical protein